MSCRASPNNIKRGCSVCASVCLYTYSKMNEWKKERKKEWKVRSWTFFFISFIERNKNERKQERNNHVICSLLHRKRKEKKAEQVLCQQSSEQADSRTKRKKERKKERKDGKWYFWRFLLKSLRKEKHLKW